MPVRSVEIEPHAHGHHVPTYVLALALAGIVNAGEQEALRLLQNSAIIFYSLAYLVMFALPLFGRQKKVLRPALWLQAASVSGFAMTAMYLVLPLFPITDVSRPLLFTA